MNYYYTKFEIFIQSRFRASSYLKLKKKLHIKIDIIMMGKNNNSIKLISIKIS